MIITVRREQMLKLSNVLDMHTGKKTEIALDEQACIKLRDSLLSFFPLEPSADMAEKLRQIKHEAVIGAGDRTTSPSCPAEHACRLIINIVDAEKERDA